ncbi:MAG: hypothetical protein SVV80_01155 [Planctomycetota bacterium]|nr:hypothetical protein [Planctomycetota bacterium]
MSILSVKPFGTFKLRAWICLTAVMAATPLIKSASTDLTGATQSAPSATTQTVVLARPKLVGKLTQPGLVESSGIVASRKYPNVYWNINDSGNPPILFAVNSNGKEVYSIRLIGAKNIDWEDIAGDADGMLYIGDVGNNSLTRKVLAIYAVGEPDPKSKAKTAVVKCKYRFGYPPGHGPFDCEAMFVRKGWAYLITKETPRARLYRVHLDEVSASAGKILQAEDLGLLPDAQWVTAADISPCGRRIAVLSYLGVWVYQLDKPIEQIAVGQTTSQPSAAIQTSPAKRKVQVVRVKPLNRRVILRQAEGICWETGLRPKALLITNEQREVYRMPLIDPDKVKH